MCDNTLNNFLYQYYSTLEVPDVIILNTLLTNVKLLETLLTEKNNSKVKISTPNNSRQKQLMTLILKNIEQNFFHDTSFSLGTLELKKILKLSTHPRIIECFDISN